MNDAPKIGMAFIGLGWWGAVLADAALASGKVKVTGGFARTPSTREEFIGNTVEELRLHRRVMRLRDRGRVIATANSVHKESRSRRRVRGQARSPGKTDGAQRFGRESG